MSFSVTEYQAEVLENELGETYVAEFPDGVTELAQYGIGLKSTSVYLSQFQLIPQARVQDLLKTQYGQPLAKGSVNNFNILAAGTLRDWNFKEWLLDQAVLSPVLHADETGTNINGDRYWIHCLCNESLTYFHVVPKRDQDAMERMGGLADLVGQLVHDHWKPYFFVRRQLNMEGNFFRQVCAVAFVSTDIERVGAASLTVAFHLTRFEERHRVGARRTKDL